MLALLAALLFGQPAAPTDSSAPDIVTYGAKRVFFLVRQDEVLLLDSAWVSYREMTVHSDSICYDVARHRLSAYGDVLFSSGGENVAGVEMEYDVDGRKGRMRTASSEVENGFFYAEEVWLVEEKVLNARRGRYTTCEHRSPHYAFYGPQVKLLMDDVAITRPVILEAFRVPVLVAPFWLVPVASERKSGLLPLSVGYSDLQGWYGRNLAYYWVINDYADATFSVDIMTRKGLQPRAEGVFRVPPFANGGIQASYIDEWDTRRRRYSFNAADVSGRFLLGTSFDAKVNYQSDNSYAPDYAEDHIDWLQRDLFSYAEIKRPVGRIGRVSVSAQSRTDFAKRSVETTAPGLSLRFGSRALPLGWTVSPSVSFENNFDRYQDSTGVDTTRLGEAQAGLAFGSESPEYRLGDATTLRVSHSAGFSERKGYWDRSAERTSRALGNDLTIETSQKLAGFLSTYQQLSASHNADFGDTLYPETRYRASANAYLALFRVFGLRIAEVDGLLHTARPQVGIEYEPGTKRDAVIGVPRLDSTRAAIARLSLRNGFEAKVGSLATKIEQGYLELSTAYDLIRPADSALAPVRARLNLTPRLRAHDSLRLGVEAGAGFDPHRLRITDDYGLSNSLTWEKSFGPEPSPDSSDTLDLTRPPDSWQIRLAIRHSFTRNSHMLTGTGSLVVPGWRVTVANVGYNLLQRRFTDYRIELWRDLHCWEAVGSVERLGERWEYDFELRIRKLPDLKIGKSTFRSILP